MHELGWVVGSIAWRDHKVGSHALPAREVWLATDACTRMFVKVSAAGHRQGRLAG